MLSLIAQSGACLTPLASMLKSIGLTLDDRGFVAVDEICRTNLQDLGGRGCSARADAGAQGEEGAAVAERI